VGLGLHLPVGVRAVTQHQKWRTISSRRALHVMSVHVMQSLISLRHVDKMLVVADAKNNACAIVYIDMMMLMTMMMMMLMMM